MSQEFDEVPAHVAATQHAPYEDKPQVQVVNETLTNATPTGYAPHGDIAVADEPATTGDIVTEAAE